MSNRKVCTKDNPWMPEPGKARVSHPDAVEEWIEENYPNGDIAHYKCPWCGIKFEVEVPQ